MKKIKAYRIIFRSRYYPFEGDRTSRIFYATSKTEARNDFYCVIHTDEYRVVRVEEVQD